MTDLWQTVCFNNGKPGRLRKTPLHAYPPLGVLMSLEPCSVSDAGFLAYPH